MPLHLLEELLLPEELQKSQVRSVSMMDLSLVPKEGLEMLSHLEEEGWKFKDLNDIFTCFLVPEVSIDYT